MTMPLDKKQMTEEYIKVQYITPVKRLNGSTT